MPVLMLVVAVVILAGVVAVASGRGGELAVSDPDYPPIDLGPVSAADVALLRPPSAAWGYNMRVTDEALEVIARAVTARDVQIAALQQQVSDLRDQLGGPARPVTAGPGTAASPARPAELDDPLARDPGLARDDELTRDDLPAAGRDPAPGGQPAPPGEPTPADGLPLPGQVAPHDPVASPDPAARQGELTPDDGLARQDPLAQHDQVTQAAGGDTAAAHDDELPEPAWPGEAGPDLPGPGPGPVPPVAITRPQPIYRHPADGDDRSAEPTAPWEPAEPPEGRASLWEPPAGHSALWEHASPLASPPSPTRSAPTAPSGPAVPDDHGWGTDPSATNPDAKPLDWAAVPPAAPDKPAAAPDKPAAGPAGASPVASPDRGGRSQPSPAPSVWDVASRQVDEDQGRRPRRADDHAEFTWDEDPHQTLVWGAANTQAKGRRLTEETMPHAEQGDDDRD